MAAHSFLEVGEQWLYACREGYVSEFTTIYRDDEDAGDGAASFYTAKASVLVQRLDVLGFTSTVAEQALARARASFPSHYGEPEPFGEWLETFQRQLDDIHENSDLPEWTVMVDPRLTLRLVLDVVAPDTTVSLNLVEVIDRGYVDPNPTRCADALRELSVGSTHSPLVILTEGSSDAEFLRRALSVVYPHISSYVRFMDYEFRPEGSTSALVRAVKAFAAVGIANRIVAVFDNDSAALDALRSLSGVQLPRNYKVITLPELELARHYPTVGPTGDVSMDINGLAVSIEVFFGRDILEQNGCPTPIHWGGFVPGVGTYQGAISDKRAVQEAFRAKCTAAPESVSDDPSWTDMTLLLDTILGAFD